MQFYDLTIPIRPGMPLWPSDPPLGNHLAKSMARGDRSNVTRLDMGAHTGTHTDAPCHFIAGGAGIDQLALDTLIGRCRVFDLTTIPGHIDRAALTGCDWQNVTRALFKTRNSARWGRAESEFDRNFVAIVADGAAFLLERGVKLVGVDYLSVEPFGSQGHPVHLALLGAGVVVIEGLNLYGVPAGDYELIALPILLQGADGAPTRVVLRTLS